MSAKIRTFIDKLQQSFREKGGYLRESRIEPILYSKYSRKLSIVIIDDRLSVVEYYIEYSFDSDSITLMEGIYSKLSQHATYFICHAFEKIAEQL